MLLGNLTGCGAVWTATLLLCRYRKTRFLAFFGKYSLQFYLNHLLIMLPLFYAAAILPVPALLQWLFIFVAATAISYVMLLIEQRIKLLSDLSGLPHKS
jgi:peptidoglycan/LPS O-acetylase OafA/YrhL